MRYRHLRRTAIAMLAAVALVLVAALVLRSVLNAAPLRRWAVGWLERYAVARGVAVEIGDLRWSMLPPTLRLSDVELASAGIGCSVERLSVDLRRLRLARRTVDLGTVAAEGIALRLDPAAARPLRAASRSPMLRFTLAHLELRRVRFAGRNLPGVQRATVRGLNASWTLDEGVPKGWVRASSVLLEPRGMEPVELALGLRFEVADALRLPRWQLRGDGFELVGGGWLAAGDGLRQRLTGRVDLAALDRVVRAGGVLRGDLQIEATVDTRAARPVRSLLRSSLVDAAGFSVHDLEASLDLVDGGLAGRVIGGRFAGGELRGSYSLAALASPYAHQVKAQLAGARLAEFLRAIGVPPAGLAARADVEAVLAWNSTRLAEGVGRGHARFTPTAGRLPVDGRLAADLRADGLLHFDAKDLGIGGSRLRWQGPLTLGSWQPEWSIRADPAVIEELSPAINSWIGSTVVPPEVAGLGLLDVTLSGPWRRLRAGLRLDAHSLSYPPLVFDRVVAEGAIDESVLRLGPVRFGVAGGLGEVAGRISWGDGQPAEQLDLDIRGQQLQLEQLARWLGIDAGVNGLASFTGGLRGSLLEPRGSWALGLDEVVVGGQEVGAGAATVALAHGEFAVNGLRFDHGLEAALQWAVTSGALAGSLRWPAMPLQFLGVAAAGVLGPRADLELDFDWSDRDLPDGRLELRSEGSRLHALATGEVVDITGSLAGGIDLELRLDRRAGGGAEGDGVIRLHAAEAVVAQLGDSAVSPLRGSGQAEFTVHWPRAEWPRAAGRISALDLEVGDRPLVLVAPAPFSVDPDGLRIDGLHVDIAGDRLFLRATAATDGALTGNITGTADLGLLRLLAPEWQTAGRARGVVELLGRVAAPAFEGVVELREGSFRIPGSRTVVSAVDGTALLSPGEIFLEGMAFRLLRGTGRARGRISQEDDGVHLLLDGSVRDLSYPLFSGFEPRLRGSWHLEGPVDDLLLSGDVVVDRATLRRRDDLAVILVDWIEESSGPSSGAGLSLDLRVEADGTLEARSPFIHLVGSASLALTGPVDSFGITGNLEFEEGGDFSFQGVRYELERGSVTFVDPTGVDALLDIQARAWVQNYQITVRLNGSFDRLVPTVSSEPPLDEAGIYSLLALGHRDESYGGGAMGVGVASTLLTRQINAELEARARLILPVDQVRLDPFVESSTGSPAARVTLVKQLTPSWTVILQSNLATERQEVIVSRWYLAPGLFVEATRDIDGTLGIDLKVRRRY